MTFRVGDVDVPIRGDGLALKCKEHCPHDSNADEEDDHGDTNDPELVIGKNAEEQAEKGYLDEVDDDRVAQFIHPDCVVSVVL